MLTQYYYSTHVRGLEGERGIKELIDTLSASPEVRGRASDEATTVSTCYIHGGR